MLLALDVGNTNTVLGLYDLGGSKPTLAAHWRVTTHRTQTVDEYGVLFVNLFKMHGKSSDEVTNIIISSVVPPVESTLRQVCKDYFHIDPMFVEPGIKTGVPVAAFDRYGGPCVIVDFGTATTFDVVSAKGEYIGGAIAPGLGISADALFSRAARLGRIDIRRPAKVIGTNTVTHLQSGLYFGYIGLVDGILERIATELGTQPKVVATGGLARQIAADSRYIKEIDDMLTLDGLRILFERNRTPKPRGRTR
jgi:type III pantothenate kinase